VQESGSNCELEPRQRPAVHLVRWVLLCGLYLLLAENLQWPELLAGAGAAVAAVTAVGALSRHNDVHFHFDSRWLKTMLALPREIVVDCALVLGSLPAMLARPRAGYGRFQRRQPRVPVPPPQLPAWRALKTAAISIAPNSYVVDVEKTRNGRILVHQLVERSATQQPKLP
jgi:multisubunit Na+/H+ antiporter MnhE subunit